MIKNISDLYKEPKESYSSSTILVSQIRCPTLPCLFSNFTHRSSLCNLFIYSLCRIQYFNFFFKATSFCFNLKPLLVLLYQQYSENKGFKTSNNTQLYFYLIFLKCLLHFFLNYIIIGIK